jgi:hypothetical protein
LLSALAIGCRARAGDSVEALLALEGPFATGDGVCAALRAAAARDYGWKAATCEKTPIELDREAPLAASVLRVEEEPPADPRTHGSGAFFLAVEAGGAWFVAPAPLDVVNGGAGHTFVPEVAPAGGATVGRRVRLQLVDTTVAVCNVCDDQRAQERRAVRVEDLAVVCAIEGAAPACTAPVRSRR